MRMISVPESWRLTFQSEALLLKALRHPNVVACYGCVQPADGQRLFSASDEELIFAQEYCEGGTLLDRVRRPRSYSASEIMPLPLMSHVLKNLRRCLVLSGSSPSGMSRAKTSQSTFTFFSFCTEP